MYKILITILHEMVTFMERKTKNYLFLSLVLVIGIPFSLILYQNVNPSNSQDTLSISVSKIGDYSFEIKMDTHSGSLDYDLKEFSYIKLTNNTKILPISWNGTLGGHHVSGILQFPAFAQQEKYVLIIENVGLVPLRTFSW